MKELVNWLKVFSDETRLQILYLLHRYGELCVCDIHETLGITQTKASRHLHILRQAGFLDYKRMGAWMHYMIVDRLDKNRAMILEDVISIVRKQGDTKLIDRHLKAWFRRKKS